MKIIEQSVEFVDEPDWNDLVKHLETCGRICYKSEQKIKANSANGFVKKIINLGHESVLEHAGFTVKFTCDRGISHQIVRHRIASYSQESTRYCNYINEEFGSEICVIKPFFFDEASDNYKIWYEACLQSEKNYFDLIKNGAKPEEARSVLPNSLKTDLVMTANMREWRHFLKLRTSVGAHPQIRQLSLDLLNKLLERANVLFSDLSIKDKIL